MHILSLIPGDFDTEDANLLTVWRNSELIWLAHVFFYKCMQSLLKIIVDLVLEGYNLLLFIPTEAIARTEYIYIVL